MFLISDQLKREKIFSLITKQNVKIGCNGANLTDKLEQTKEFLDNHNELVVLEMTHFCKTSSNDSALLALLELTLGDRIYKEKAQNNTSFIHRNLKEILDDKEAKGKAVLLMNTLSQETENQERGFFSMSFLPFSGTYANEFDFKKMEMD